MKTLAGDNGCDRHIRRELERARIDIVGHDELPKHSEVPYLLTGKLGGFTFVRAWSYWRVEGPMPLDKARELYDDPIGKTDVRVAGHCGCPPPKFPWVTHLTKDGRRLIKASRHEQSSMDEHDPGWRDELVASADPEGEAYQSVVSNYHIDSEAGLRLFADAVRSLHGNRDCADWEERFIEPTTGGEGGEHE